jgi:hypothetical protein
LILVSTEVPWVGAQQDGSRLLPKKTRRKHRAFGEEGEEGLIKAK